jgi:hypothetical protein
VTSLIAAVEFCTRASASLYLRLAASRLTFFARVSSLFERRQAAATATDPLARRRQSCLSGAKGIGEARVGA